jgi:protease I
MAKVSKLLTGKGIAILITNSVEHSELTEPRAAMEPVGAAIEMISLENGEVRAMKHQAEGDKFKAHVALSSATLGTTLRIYAGPRS